MTSTERVSVEEVSRIAAAHGFSVRKAEDIAEIEGIAYTMLHEASGARLLYLCNDDANKAFSITFKTPAADDTGVFHILEHSVLNGSRKFPVKEPFVNLLKTSMQTFLNAMTFPDKTMYPVASTNEQDLMNLMDVYLDAVFYPAIYDKRAIFEQEGWHYELIEGAAAGADATGEPAAEADTPGAGAAEASAPGSDAAERLVYNGVVYNEMKGALSDPDSVLYDTLSAAMFPDTTYRFESGGTPESIPTLTYEGFAEAHRRHYRPDNSYIILYGNLDPDRFLGFIDEEYLAPLARADCGPLAVNALENQAPVRPALAKRSMVTSPENACVALGFAAGAVADRERLVAVEILLDALMGSNEAPMKRALLDAGIAADATAYLADAIRQPFAVVQLRGLRDGSADDLARIVRAQADELAAGALDHALVEASLSRSEFQMRERNFGYPDGVVLAMTAMSGWLYDDELSTAYLRYDELFKSLRRKLDEGYFEQLTRELFLENDHAAAAEVVPVEALEENAEADRLAAAAARMTPADLEQVRADVEALRTAQEAPDDPADVAKLPQLPVSAIGEAPGEGAFALDESQPIACLRHDIPTHGIAYAYRYFDLRRIPFDELPYVTVLAMMLGKLGTAHHSAAEIDTLVQSTLGNLSFFSEVHENVDDPALFAPKFVVGASALSEKTTFMATLAKEVMCETDFSDHAKMRDVLLQKRVAFEQGCASAGHSVAMGRVASYYLPAAVVRERLGGIDFYRFLKELTDRFDERADDLERRLTDLARRLFTDDACVLSFTGTDDDLARFWDAGALLGPWQGAGVPAPGAHLVVPEPRDRHEAFAVPTDVTFTAAGFDRRLLGAPYGGSWLVASRALTYGYLWNEVRVKGGAYGVGFQVARAGSMRFYSFRDPHVDETIERFAAAGSWLAGFDPSPAEFEGYIVSTTAGVDAPLKARELMRRQDGMHFAGYAQTDRLLTRAQVVESTVDAVRGLGRFVTDTATRGLTCAVGNRAILEAARADFDVIDLLGK